ncbi:MAG: glycosyltransferase, partial [Anaerolineales bacterium]|nr:glycosyltransferase [Anaerolineales bacterium]
CRLHIPRDFDTLLNAFAQTLTRFPKLHLLITGDGPQREQILNKISRLELADHVHLLGFRQDISQLLALADVVVLTSLGWEGYPLSTLEAQATGTPIVVTDAGGSREAVLHEKTGLVVPKQNAAAMAQALVSLLENTDLQKQMGIAGRERAQAELSREIMVEKMTAVYQLQLKSITGRFGP